MCNTKINHIRYPVWVHFVLESEILKFYLVFGQIHMLDLRFGRPTYPSTKIFCPHPSIYQFFCQFLLLNPFIYLNLTLKTTYLPIFCQFLLVNPSIYQNFTLKPIRLPKLHTFWGKWPTHLSTSALQNPPIYIEHTYPWKHVSTPSGQRADFEKFSPATGI